MRPLFQRTIEEPLIGATVSPSTQVSVTRLPSLAVSRPSVCRSFDDRSQIQVFPDERKQVHESHRNRTDGEGKKPFMTTFDLLIAATRRQ